jgi:AcrR family transcriptional regulator
MPHLGPISRLNRPLTNGGELGPDRLEGWLTVGDARPVRRRSASARRNDELLLDAALAEIDASGVDRLRMASVAQRAGLTTGALYSRYENSAELAADVWTQRIRDRHRAFLSGAVHALVDDEPAGLDAVLAELRSPSAEAWVALELLVAARRTDELEEVVIEDLRSWMTEWGAAPDAEPRRRAQVLMTLGTIWGVLLHVLPGREDLDWAPILTRLAWSFRQPAAAPAGELVPDPVGPVRAVTEDAAHTVLIESVAAVVARVGLDRATASRIARRAGVTPGAIYARYDSKEHLVESTVDIMLARRLEDDMAEYSYTFTDADPGLATARIIAGYLSPARLEWRHFRIETRVASRRYPALAATLRRVQSHGIRVYLDTLGARTADERAALDLLARFAMLTPLGLNFADTVLTDLGTTDWRLVTESLLSPDSG